MFSRLSVPDHINRINSQLNGGQERQRPSGILWAEYQKFLNKLSLGVGGSHTGIPESLKLLGDPCRTSFLPVESGLD